MRFASLDIVRRAVKQGWAVPAFNINDTAWIEAALTAAQEERSPVILASSDRLADYLGGFPYIRRLVEIKCRKLGTDVPVVLHLDHGKNAKSCMAAIDAGYSSVMIDGSELAIEGNIAVTMEVAAYARQYGVSVEAEVGTVGGNENGLVAGIRYADPEECLRLVKETGVDALAAALGSVHGLYRGEPKLSFERMEDIASRVRIPLVLHGASGIPSHQITRCIELGHGKININTECNQVWIEAVRNTLISYTGHETREVLEPAFHALKEYMKARIRQFGSSGRV